jgi:hypothetical protein
MNIPCLLSIRPMLFAGGAGNVFAVPTLWSLCIISLQQWWYFCMADVLVTMCHQLAMLAVF